MASLRHHQHHLLHIPSLRHHKHHLFHISVLLVLMSKKSLKLLPLMCGPFPQPSVASCLGIGFAADVATTISMSGAFAMPSLGLSRAWSPETRSGVQGIGTACVAISISASGRGAIARSAGRPGQKGNSHLLLEEFPQSPQSMKSADCPGWTGTSEPLCPHFDTIMSCELDGPRGPSSPCCQCNLTLWVC